MEIPNISLPSSGIREIKVYGPYLWNIPRDLDSKSLDVNSIGTVLRDPPQAIPPVVPVVTNIGTPVVNIPGCVNVHKENARQRSKNKVLPQDDPEGTITLCDGGAPYYNPPDYNPYNMVYTYPTPEAPEAEALNMEPPPVPEPPKPPNAGGTETAEKKCPPDNARRVGDLSQSGDEKVVGYEWNVGKTECITLWEPVTAVEKYLPSTNVVSTTATIAVVATTSALLAKPLADLLLKIVKPAIKKTMDTIKKKLGKEVKVQSLMERQMAQRDRNRAIRELKRSLKK